MELVIRKFFTRNIIPVRRIFSTEILVFDRWLMVIPSIDHGNSIHMYLTLTLVASLEHVKALQQPLPIYLCTHDSQVCS